jgi:hypothetical protein
MRVPRIKEWGAAGDPDDGAAFITFKRIPLHWWLLHHWLEYGHPHWGWWHRFWMKVVPYWGDPFCAACLTAWSRFYWSREEDRATIEVGWDRLRRPSQARSRLAAPTMPMET